MMRKRVTGWIVGGSMMGAVFAAALVAACSSSSGGAPDAGTDATSNGGTDAAGDGNFLLPDGACLPSTYNVETIDAGSTWACYQSVCGSELTMCASDCVCNDDILTALQCTANGGTANDCFTAAFAATYLNLSSSVVLVGNCVVNTSNSGGCPNGSPTPADAGADAAGPDANADAGQNATPDGSADAASDAPSAAAPDASPDAATTDSGADGGASAEAGPADAGADASADAPSAD